MNEEFDNLFSNHTFKILIVEDDEDDRFLIRDTLNQMDLKIEVCEATSSEKALELMKRNHFDCILLDYLLPDLDGLEFLNRKEQETESAAPVIFLTGVGDELLAVKALKGGAADYIPKMLVSEQVLSRSIKNALAVKVFAERAHTAERLLGEKEALYRNIVEKVSDIIFQVDVSGAIIFCNSAFKLLGYDPSDLVGMPVDRLIVAEDPQELEEIRSALTTQGVGPLAVSDLLANIRVNPDSPMVENFDSITYQLDAFGLWDVPDEMVFKSGVPKKHLGTLCIGRKQSSGV